MKRILWKILSFLILWSIVLFAWVEAYPEKLKAVEDKVWLTWSVDMIAGHIQSVKDVINKEKDKERTVTVEDLLEQEKLNR